MGTFVATAVTKELAGAARDVKLEEVVGTVLVVGTRRARLNDHLLSRPAPPHKPLATEKSGHLIVSQGVV